MNNRLYEMNEGEVIGIGLDADVLRVPGGWIYTKHSESGAGGYSISSCFVPWHNEFQDETQYKQD